MDTTDADVSIDVSTRTARCSCRCYSCIFSNVGCHGAGCTCFAYYVPAANDNLIGVEFDASGRDDDDEQADLRDSCPRWLGWSCPDREREQRLEAKRATRRRPRFHLRTRPRSLRNEETG